MARNPHLANRDKNIVNDYLEGASVAELEHSYGICTRMIYLILKNANVEVNARRVRRPLSPLHQHVGRLLVEGAFDMGHDRRRVVDQLG